MPGKSESISTAAVERAILAQVISAGGNKIEFADSLDELERLADTAGVSVAGRITQRRDRPSANFFIGEGKLADIQLACRETASNLVIFDNELSAMQVNNLDLALGIKVIDRTELILQIFARRARSAEAQIQVELAQLQYLITRIPVSAKQHRFHGGIGMRGPGESPLQLRNEPMRRRISDLKAKLETIKQRRRRTRSGRSWPLACLVGYTNAGKSTLLNALAAASAYVDDRLFATLDTKTRIVRLADGKKIQLVDTVGFIRNLPHGLIASFRSTLEVAVEADILLMVADAGFPRIHDHIDVINSTLSEIGATTARRLLVLNKCDTRGAKLVEHDLCLRYPSAVRISALEKNGLETLSKAIALELKDVTHRRDPDWKS